MRSIDGQRAAATQAPTSVTLFDQGLLQVLQASVTGLEPKQRYVLALATGSDGSGTLESVGSFMTNPAGSAIVNAVGPIRQLVRSETLGPRRHLVISRDSARGPGAPVQLQDVTY
jgi:hypothetical protein